MPHSALYNSTFYTLHFAPYTSHSHSTLHTLHLTPHTPHCTRYTSHFTLYTPHFTLHTLHSIPHSTHFGLHTSHSTFYTLHPTPHTSHSIFNTLHLHCTLDTPLSTRGTQNAISHPQNDTPSSNRCRHGGDAIRDLRWICAALHTWVPPSATPAMSHLQNNTFCSYCHRWRKADESAISEKTRNWT